MHTSDFATLKRHNLLCKQAIRSKCFVILEQAKDRISKLWVKRKWSYVHVLEVKKLDACTCKTPFGKSGH